MFPMTPPPEPDDQAQLTPAQKSHPPDESVVEVYRAKNGAQAHLFATALTEAGIKAEVQGKIFHPPMATADNPMTDSAPWWDAPRILVRTADAERAKRLLLELEERARNEAQEAKASPLIEVACEECGSLVSFPESQRGSVQSCPQCGAYVDVEDELPDT
jgi:hypothetical protein